MSSAVTQVNGEPSSVGTDPGKPADATLAAAEAHDPTTALRPVLSNTGELLVRHVDVKTMGMCFVRCLVFKILMVGVLHGELT